MPASRSTWCTVLLLGLFCLWAWMSLDGLRLLDRSGTLAPTLLRACLLLGIAFSGIGLAGAVLAGPKPPAVPRPSRAHPDHLALGWDPAADWIRVSDEALQHHSLVLGSSGSGKTQLLLSLLAQQLQRGGGALMIDAKVDRSALQAILALCRRVNRLHELRVIWPTDPTISDSWNPLLRGDLAEVQSRIMALWGTNVHGEADFWRGAAHTIIHAVLGAMRAIDPLVTFQDLYVALTSADALMWLERNVPAGTEEASALGAFLSNYRNQQGTLNIDHLKRMTGGVPQYVSAYAWGNLGQVMNNTRPTLDLLEALRTHQIVYVALPILAQTEQATAMARMLVAELKQAVGVLQQQAERSPIPYLVLMDEASAYTNVEGIERLFEQARSAGVALVAASQVLSGFATINKAQMDFILGNTATKILMSLGDPTSAETMADTIGEERALFRTQSEVDQRGTTAPWISPLPTRASKGQSAARGATERYDYVVRPEHLTHQQTGQAVIFVRDPRHGSVVYPDVHTCYLQLPSNGERPPVRRTHGHQHEGLNLLERLREAGATAGVPQPARRGGNRPPRGPRQRETQHFTVTTPAAPEESA